VTLLRRAAGRVAGYADGHRGIATSSLRDRLMADAARVEEGTLVPGPDAMVEPPTV
jgi:hypothetical protein